MSAGRLRVEGPDDGQRHLIPGIAAPLQGVGRAHSLIQALEIALERIPAGLTYDDLMGLSGIAFRTPPWPGQPNLSAEETFAALDALNLALDPPLRLYGAEQALERERILQLVASSVDLGIPCLAFGWGSVKERWSIITGYHGGDGRLYGHCVLERPREAYESWPAELTYLVTVPGSLAVPAACAFAAADGAHDRWVGEGRARYRRWIAGLRDPRCQADAVHEAAVELLADGRGAAAAFLARLAATQEGNRAAWVARAAEVYDRLLEVLEGRGAAPFSEAALIGLRDAGWRAGWAARLEQMAELEEQAASALRRASSAEFPPEELYEP